MKNQKFLDSLTNCMNYCNWCADQCLDEDDIKKMVPCIRVDKACAATCNALAEVLATEYKDVQGLVTYCLDICGKCADECEKMEAEHCKKCAQACRDLEENLRNFTA